MLHYSRTGLYKMLEKDSIDTKLLLRISQLLDYDFFDAYSAFLKESKKASENSGGGRNA